MREVYELWNGSSLATRAPTRPTRPGGPRSSTAIFEAWERQQEEVQRLEDFIRRFRYQATKAALVQSRVKQLEKIVPIEIPEGMKRIHFAFPPAPHSGKATVKLEGLRKAYGAHRVIGAWTSRSSGA